MEDRRVVRTRQLLRESLVSLILERGYDAITVQDILDRANLGRSTFYAHYRNKEDLLFSGFEELVAGIHALAAQGAEGHDLSLHLFRHVTENRRLLKALLGRQGGKAVFQRSQAALGAMVRRHLEQVAPGAEGRGVPLDIAVCFYTSSLFALLTWWLDHDPLHSAEEMDAMFKRLALPGLRAALGLDGPPS